MAEANLPCLWLLAQGTGTPLSPPCCRSRAQTFSRMSRKGPGRPGGAEGRGGRCSGLAEGRRMLAGPAQVEGGGWRAYRSSRSRRGEGLCRILLWASAWSMPSALSPLMATIMSPGRRSAASALPRSVTCGG